MGGGATGTLGAAGGLTLTKDAGVGAQLVVRALAVPYASTSWVTSSSKPRV